MDLHLDPASCPVCHNFEVQPRFHGRLSGDMLDYRGDENYLEHLGDKYPCVYIAPLEKVGTQAFRGCKGCSLIHAGFQLFWTQTKELDWQKAGCPKLEISINIKKHQYAVVETTNGLASWYASGGLRVYIMPLSGAYTPWPHLKKLPTEAVSPSPTERATRYRGWIQDCLNNHQTCGPHDNDGYPSRLIDVGSSTNTAAQLFLQHFPTKPDDCHQYVTLSHCWASTDAFSSRTTSEKLQRRRTSLNWDDLSQTFRDAVEVTRWLGIQYLWIDSVCIVQDDQRDLSRELSKMGKIYAGSYVTLAAQFDPECSPADTVNDGLFLQHRRNFMRIEQQNEAGQLFPTIVSTSVHHDTDSPPSLMRRAWCFQERILSPRVLHFKKDDVVFECASSMHCECTGSPSNSIPGGKEWLKKGFSSISTRSPLSQDWIQKRLASLIDGTYEEIGPSLKDVWNSVVKDYSRMELSYATDKLSALSGLAEKIPQHYSGRYLAGLWSEDLHWYLLWSVVKDPQCRPTRHTEYVAPTFSWASISAPVEFGYVAPEPFRKAAIFLTNCKPQDESLPFDKVNPDSFLKLRCYVRTMKFKRTSSKTDPMGLELVYVPEGVKRSGVEASVDTMDDIARAEGKKVIIAEILGAVDSRDYLSSETLILAPHCTQRGHVKNEYDRVGRARFEEVTEDLFLGCEYRAICLF